MSASERNAAFAALASDIAAAIADAIEKERLDDIPDDSLGQAFGAIVRLYAAKAQLGDAPRPFGRNSGVTVTDVAIGCTALLESVGLEVFELGAWQSMSGIGRLTPQLTRPRVNTMLDQAQRLPRSRERGIRHPHAVAECRRPGDRAATMRTFLIVDVDSHHYETEAFKEIAEYIDDPVLRSRSQVTRACRAAASRPRAARIRRSAAASRAIRCARPRRCRRTPHRDITLMERWMDAHGRRHGGHVSDADAQPVELPAHPGRGRDGDAPTTAGCATRSCRQDPRSNRCSICRSTIRRRATRSSRSSPIVRASSASW